jgi:hypothetical protein
MFVSFFIFVTKILEKNNLRKERFVLAHSFRGFRPWPLASCKAVFMAIGMLDECVSPHGSQKQREREREKETYFL